MLFEMIHVDISKHVASILDMDVRCEQYEWLIV